MPCSENRPSRGEERLQTQLSVQRKENLEKVEFVNALNGRLRDQLKERDAMVCALLSQFDRAYTESVEDFVIAAEDNGGVEIKTWWFAHRKEDDVRLKGLVSEFSKDELTRLKTLFANGEIV